jgi:DNA-binding CsgD family transcriptional regulator
MDERSVRAAKLRTLTSRQIEVLRLRS